MLTSRALKLQARGVIHRRLATVLLVAAAYLAVNYFLSWLSRELTGVNAWYAELNRRLAAYVEEIQTAVTMEELTAIVDKVSMPDVSFFVRGPFANVLAALIGLAAYPLEAGYTFHALQESRGTNTSVKTLFSGFQLTLRVIGIGLLTNLMVFLGVLFFIVPGVILACRYSMAVYILLDDPEKGVLQCLRESGALMRGNKWRLFMLELSFLGWLILSFFVTSLVGLPLLNLWLMPYLVLSRSFFYNGLVPGRNFTVNE